MAREAPQISKLDTKVQVYGLTVTRNALLEAKTERVLLADTFAAMNDTAGNRATDKQTVLSMSRSYVIRRRDGIVGGKDLRLKDGDAVYLVDHVRKIGRTHLELICTSFGDDITTGDNGGGDGGDGGGGTALQILNESQPNYYTLGTPFSLQILTNIPATTYGVFNLPSALSVDAATGLITGTLTGAVGVTQFTLTAETSGDFTSKLFFLTKVDYDMSVLRPPQNLTITAYYPTTDAGPSFDLRYLIPVYTGQYERMEIFKDGVLWRTFVNGQPYDLDPGIRSDRMQGLPKNVDILFKMRFKNTAGQYSDFSEEITAHIPNS